MRDKQTGWQKFLVCAFILFLSSCSYKDPYNTLTEAEEKQQWQLLFDGQSLQGWHGYNEKKLPTAWRVQEGELQCIAKTLDLSHGDLVSDSLYKNFDLRFEWKIAKGGNGGVLINVQEDPKYGTTFMTGPEFQLLDNENDPVHRGDSNKIAGCMYGVVPQQGESRPRPFGQWNESRILQQNGRITFWLNGILTSDVTLNSDAWNRFLSKSTLRLYPDFGKAASGRIGLQDHNDSVSFRGIKVRPL